MLQSHSSEKKLVKPLKNCFFGPNLHQKRVIMGHFHNGKNFFGRNNKSRSSAFKNLFYQNMIGFDWFIKLFLSWVMFTTLLMTLIFYVWVTLSKNWTKLVNADLKHLGNWLNTIKSSLNKKKTEMESEM